MVEIQCPHCEEVVELEDNSFGLFDCPHCGDTFEYESSSSDHDSSDSGSSGLTQNQLSLAISISGLILGVLAIMVFFNALSFDTICPEEDRSTSMIDGEEFISCNSDEFLWETQTVKLLFGSCCLMVPGSFFLTILGYSMRKQHLGISNRTLGTETTPHASKTFPDSKLAASIQASAMFFGIGISAMVAIMGAVLIGFIGFLIFVIFGQ